VVRLEQPRELGGAPAEPAGVEVEELEVEPDVAVVPGLEAEVSAPRGQRAER
jgi:hypothetical protein